MQKLFESETEAAYNLGGCIFIEAKGAWKDGGIEARRAALVRQIAELESVPSRQHDLQELKAQLDALDNIGGKQPSPGVLEDAFVKMCLG